MSKTAAPDGGPATAWSDVLTERRRQVDTEGWTADHDDLHSNGEMARAAGIYALIAGSNPTNYRNATGGYNLGDVLGGLMEHYWPWDKSWFRPSTRRRDLVKAGALILAEIERIDRFQNKPAPRLAGTRSQPLPKLINGKSRQIRTPRT
ncbi:hypothetical protein FJ872_19675 [Mesorhizobium sp. B2-5-9]|uniref:hypothetical protein n=1 Tax=Mesorhizobium sp. B2-5-9 TaxID=2589921 RepID=UPI0011285A6C|nr:hypothetical protein [Mesorhizobium sp. B2-5-9]TPK15215.1 hypothetical protein FJ872_19675 [Mesorhizobium sp. B2-5-9]